MAGYWKGTATQRGSERAVPAFALIEPGGDSQWIVRGSARDDDDDDDEAGEQEGFVLFGDVCCGSGFDGDLAAKAALETRSRKGELAVEPAGAALRGEIRFRGRRYEISLARAQDHDRTLSLQRLAGVYTRATSLAMTMTIERTGRITGSYANGCIFSGAAALEPGAAGIVRLQIELANCGSGGSSRQWNGQYTGVGVLLPNAPSPSGAPRREDVFRHSLVGSTWLGVQDAGR